MTSKECKKVSMINEYNPKHQAEGNNKPKKCINSRKKYYLKPQGKNVLNLTSDKRKPTPYNKG